MVFDTETYTMEHILYKLSLSKKNIFRNIENNRTISLLGSIFELFTAFLL